MKKEDEVLIMKAIAICFKPYLKPEEACIYCNLGRTQLAKRFDESGIYKTTSGYYKKEEIDTMLGGGQNKIAEKLKDLKK